MKILKMRLENFQGVKELEIDPQGESSAIYGDNGTGKSTVYNAFTWLMYGKPSTTEKNYTPKTTGSHNLHHSVEMTVELADGSEMVLKKDYHEVYKTIKGNPQPVLSGHTTDYSMDGVPVSETQFKKNLLEIYHDEELAKMLTSYNYFLENMKVADRRKILLQVCGDADFNEVIESQGDLLRELPEMLRKPGKAENYYTVDEYRAIAAKEKNLTDKELGDIPQRIDEAEKANPDPINWNTVDLNALALDVVHYARMGLDMMQDNHLSAIPFKDNNRLSRTGTKMYVVNLMPGYNGIQYIAEKYALEKPVSVTVELVYSTDTFKPLKKNRENRIESYDFEINNAFDRGQIVGGFGYIEYEEPTKNKLIIMTLKDILKRKPEKASGEFWGGKKTAWEKGQKVEVETEGWFEEMCLKTVKREVYSAKNMPRDPKKIDDAYEYMRMQEIRLAQMETQEVIDAEANQVVIDTEAQETPQKPAQPAFLTDDGGQQALDLGSPAKPQAQPQPARNTTAARSTAARAAGPTF